MKEEKDKLRNELFEKYFENEEGIVLSDLVKMIKPVVDVWQEVHENLVKNVEWFDKYSSLDEIKVVNNNGKNYFIIKGDLWKYLIVDLENKKVLNEEDVSKNFNEDIFVREFNEEKTGLKTNYLNMYNFLQYDGNINDLLDLYIANENILNSKNEIRHEINIDEAFAILRISLMDGGVYLGFETPDQFLYEHLWMNSDLTPCGIQDAQSRIGKEKMCEMFEKVKDIKIPDAYILPEIYKEITKELGKKPIQKKIN